MADESRFSELAEAVADGRAPDWASAEASAGSDAERKAVEAFRDLVALGKLFAAAHQPDDVAADHSILDSIRTPGDQTEPAPTTWGPFEIREKIGRGSYGDVYRAWDPKLGREVALKLLRHRQAGAGPATLVREAHLLARVRHPNVVTVYGAEEIDGRTGLWMEFIRGETLEDELQRRGPLPPEEVRRIGIDLSAAVAAVHAAGLMHGDIKTQNVVRDPDGRLVLMDFGTGHVAGDATAHQVQGTPAYLAPEILAGSPRTEQGDVYALGVLLFRLATAAFPVAGRTLAEVREAHRAAPPDRQARVSPVIEQSVARDTSRRFASARSLHDALVAEVTPTKPTSRRGLAYGAVLAVTVAALGVGSWLARDRLAGTRVGAPATLFAGAEDILALPPVLIGSFTNETGDASLDGSIEAALTSTLLRSPALSVAPADRNSDALQLAAQQLPIDGSKVRQIFLADPLLRLAITGRLTKGPEGYVLRTELASPTIPEPQVIELRRMEIDGLLTAVDEIGTSVHQALGLTSHRDAPSRGAASASLRALTLYHRAFIFPPAGEGRFAARAELARQAAEADPSFVLAQIWHAYTLRMAGRKPSDFSEPAERALAAASTLTGWERHWVEGLYYTLAGNKARAYASFKTLLAMKPDHFHAARIVRDEHYSGSDYTKETAALAVNVASMRPNNPGELRAAANLLLLTGSSIDAAAPYAARVADLTTGAFAEYRFEGAWARAFPAFELWAAGDSTQAARLADAAMHRAPSMTASARKATLKWLGLFYLTLGRPTASLEAATGASDPASEGVALFAAGKLAEARERVGSLPPQTEFSAVCWVLTETGDLDAVASRIAAFKPNNPNLDAGTTVAAVGIARGHLLLARGRAAEAIPALRDGVLSSAVSARGNFIRGSEMLAEALRQEGQLAEAATTLQNAWSLRLPFENRLFPTNYYWLRDGVALARVLRQQGNIAKATDVEAQLDRLLAAAEPDFPLLLELRRLRAGR